jgi:hypothetical protein
MADHPGGHLALIRPALGVEKLQYASRQQVFALRQPAAQH